MRPDGPRDPYAGPESGPEPPFPIKLCGPVIKGFGRGSKELGIPTANIPPEGLSAYPDLATGIYYGYVGLCTSHPPDNSAVTLYPSVLSIGYNLFYGNTTRSVEVHILHKFSSDFYGAFLNLLILGYIRPEYDYVSKESLIEDIMTDCDVARRSLERPAYSRVVEEEKESKEQKWLRDCSWAKKLTEEDVKRVEEKVLGVDAKGEEKPQS